MQLNLELRPERHLPVQLFTLSICLVVIGDDNTFITDLKAWLGSRVRRAAVAETRGPELDPTQLLRQCSSSRQTFSLQ